MEYFLLLDTETANEMPDNLVYDFGFTVINELGEVCKTGSYVINDIFFDEKELMESAYFAEKIPNYIEDIKQGKRKVCTLNQARIVTRDVMAEFGIKTVLAYNVNFDNRALNKTQRYLTKSKYRWFFPFGTQFECIWNMACQVICSDVDYLKWAIENKKFSPSGKYISTSAETVYAYLTGQVEFIESHTGLEDCIIEGKIFAECVAKNQPMERKADFQCWRKPTKIAKEMGLM